MSQRTLSEKLSNQFGPKRILSLDGGGVRGILTLGILKSIEEKARKEAGNAELRLCDHFDLIGGTSTGAIIACGLAIGLTVDHIISLYQSLGKEIFGEGRKHKFLKRSSTKLRAIFNENYDSVRLEKYLYDIFKEIHIADNQNIRCGLAINSKRADTYSLWTVANHPEGIYYNANSHLKLWELCRASSAAPYYFRPKKLTLRTQNGEPFETAFIDGGVSLANNPAWQTFLVAIVTSFGFNWKTGEENLHITSIGTGNGSKLENPNVLENEKAVAWATKIPDLFMTDALEMNETLMYIFGKNKGLQTRVDSQFEGLSDISLDNKALFSFARWNVKLQGSFLKELGFEFTEDQIISLKEMDHFENMDSLLEIGKKYGEMNIIID